MSRPSLRTGEILLKTRNKSQSPEPSERHEGAPMHIVLIGDFSGRGSRSEIAVETIASRRIIEIDRDNFEEVFSDLKVELALPVAQETIKFREFDDLHPDILFEQVSLFEKFRTLKRKLKNPKLFQQAADEILQWSSHKPELKLQKQSEDASVKEEAIALPDNMLDAILTQNVSIQNSDAADIDHLIRDIVAPYIETKKDPRLPEFEAAVENAISHSMRKLMHSGAFLELEANWRSLYFLVRRLETSKKLKIFLVDVTRDEIVDDLINCDALEDSGIYKRLIESYQVPGAKPFSLLQFNYQLHDDLDDMRIAAAMAQMAEQSHAVALGGVSEKLAGCESLFQQQDCDLWQYEIEEHITEAWEQVRQDTSAKHLALVAPRMLMRMPYGKKSSPIESFSFEELGEKNEHEYYCWGSGASAVTLLLAQSYLRSGWNFSASKLNEIDNLPLHIYQDDGESLAKACAEIFMHDGAANKLADTGILSLRSIKGRAAILVSNFRSVAKNGSGLFT